MNRFASDVIFALRSLRKSPTFALVAILTLVLSIGVNAAIFSVVNAVLLRPLPFRDSTRLVRIWSVNEATQARSGLSQTEVVALREQNVFDSIAETFPYELNIESSNGTLRTRAAHVDAELFTLLGVHCSLGRTFERDETESHGSRIAVLSHRTWLESFGGDRRIIGRVFNINGQPYAIIGVLEPTLNRFPTGADSDVLEDVEVWTPLARIRAAMQRRPGVASRAHIYGVVARLRPMVALETADARVNVVSRRLSQEAPLTNEALRLRMTTLHQAIVGDIRPVLILLMCAVGMVLLVGCANLANLMLARGVGRQKEMAIRRAVGASAATLIGQTLTESVVLALIGGVGGVALAMAIVAGLKRFAPAGLPRMEEVSIDVRVVLFSVGLSVATGIVFGLIPAIKLSRVDLNSVLKAEGNRGASAHRSRGRAVLVIAEVAITLMLVSAAALLSNSLVRLTRVQLGFLPDHLLTMKVAIPNSRYPNNDRASQLRFFETMIARLERESTIVSASVSSVLPLQPNDTVGFSMIGGPLMPEDRRPKVFKTSVTPDYFATFAIPVTRGRGIQRDDSGKRPWVAVINESMANRYWRGNALGRQIQLNSDVQPRIVVGIVRDSAQNNVGEQPIAQVYVPYQQETQWVSYTTLAIRTRVNPRVMEPSVEKIVRSLDPMVGVSHA